MSIFDFLAPEKKPEKPRKILSVGDKIGKVVLGECYVATITEVEGLPDYPFYRTDAGICYYPQDGEKSIEELERIAEKERMKYKTIIPRGLSERITAEYEPRECDGRVLWAQIGIIGNMLFWMEKMTYQFLEPYDSEKNCARNMRCTGKEFWRTSIRDSIFWKKKSRWKGYTGRNTGSMRVRNMWRRTDRRR